MNLFQEQNSEENLQQLTGVIGRTIQQLFLPEISIDVSQKSIQFSSCSIPIEGTYLIIQNDWNDTPKEYLDYYHLKIFVSTAPKDLKIEKKKGMKAFSYPTSTISLGVASPISKIEIYQYEEDGDDESVLYDRAIIVSRDDDLQILFTVDDTIAGQVEFSSDDNLISEVRNKLSLRVLITKEGIMHHTV